MINANLLQITSRCCEVSLALTYVKIQIAINNYHDRQKINQLRLEARDLKRINPEWDFSDSIPFKPIC
jgi:hypothetical protein